MSNVSLENFASEISTDLKIEDDDFVDTDLCSFTEYDSMGKIAVSLTIERLFDFQVPLEVLDGKHTIKSLHAYCVAEAG